MKKIKYPTLNPFRKKITSGVSLINAVKNRNKSLQESLSTWVLQEKIDEIIIVDWFSDESLVPLIDHYQNGKILLVTVKNQGKWILSHAFNLAARFASFDKILKMDADVKIQDGLFENHKIEPGNFFTGNWANARVDNERHLHGTVFLFRDDFFSVNGYNEFIKSYGWDDIELYSRLEDIGLKRIDFLPGTFHHIEHGNRSNNQEGFSFLKNLSEQEWIYLNNYINQYISEYHEKWSDRNKMMDFNIEIVNNHYIIAEKAHPDLNLLPESFKLESELYAMKKRLTKSGYNFAGELLNLLNREEVVELYNLFLSIEQSPTGSHLFHLITKFNSTHINTVHIKSQEIIRKNIQIREISKEIENRETLIAKMDLQIQDLKHKIQHCDKIIDEQNNANDNLIHTKNDLELLLQRKDLEIHKNQQGIEQLLRKNQELERTIELKDQELQERNKSLIAIEQNIHNHELKLFEMNVIIMENAHIAQNDKQTIEDLKEQLVLTHNQLSEIYHSYSWKTGHFVFKQLSRIFPRLNREKT